VLVTSIAFCFIHEPCQFLASNRVFLTESVLKNGLSSNPLMTTVKTIIEALIHLNYYWKRTWNQTTN